MTRTIALLAVACCTAVTVQASYLPFLDSLRSSIVERQITISNAPPIDAAGKKELNALKIALKAIDKPSTSLKTDLAALGAVVKSLNKGASNETFSFEMRTAISNYVGVLQETNGTLQGELVNATNNAALKQKALGAIATVNEMLDAIQPETDLNGAAKALPKVLPKLTSAEKAVTVALNAKPAPIPTPKAGSLVLMTGGDVFVDRCQGFVRNADFTAFPMSTNGMIFSVEIPGNGKPGTYNVNLVMPVQLNGQAGTIALSDVPATVSAATATAIVGYFTTTATFVPTGGVPYQISISVRFSGKIIKFGP